MAPTRSAAAPVAGGPAPRLHAVAPGFEYRDETYPLGVRARDLRRAQQLLSGHLACAAQFGWQPDEPADLERLLAAGRVGVTGSGPAAALGSVTIRLRRSRRDANR